MGTSEPRIGQLPNDDILKAFAEFPEHGVIFDEYRIDFGNREKLEDGLSNLLTDVAFALPIAKLMADPLIDPCVDIIAFG
jgi:hypothetical protein